MRRLRAFAGGEDGPAFGHLVFAETAVEDQLVSRRRHARRGGFFSAVPRAVNPSGVMPDAHFEIRPYSVGREFERPCVQACSMVDKLDFCGRIADLIFDVR